jgi:hypothetical protein
MDLQHFSDEVINLALSEADGVDEAIRLLPVAPTARRPGADSPWLRTLHRRLSEHAAQERAQRSRAGVFLAGATQDQARQWAQRLARKLRGTVRGVEVHGEGRPHFHVDYRQGGRQRSTGHIFYGRPPAGRFFDAGDE